MQRAIARFVRQSAIAILLALGLSDLTLFSQQSPPPGKPGVPSEPAVGWLGRKAARQPAIGYVHDTSGFTEGGCSLWLRGDRPYTLPRTILQSDFNDRAVMNIGGQDTALQRVDSTDPSKGTKGERSMYHYRGKGVDVVVRYVITGVCAPNDESCEVDQRDATLIVQTKSGKRVVHAEGICGT